MSTQLATIQPQELVRQSTDIASLCKSIVVASAVAIEGRKYVKVEGWQSIATAHGCVASARDVRKVEGGIVATGEIRRMADGVLLASAEGFVGEDEPTWFGGETEVNEWVSGRKTGKKIRKILPKRPEYAIRAMAQTRAISRACRGCFAHVVVLMDAGLSTTPAEEVPEGGFNESHDTISQVSKTLDDWEKSTPSKASELPMDSGEPIWKDRTVKNVEEVPYGDANPRKVFFKVTFDDDRTANTFDTKLRDAAEKIGKDGDKCIAKIKPGKRAGSWNLVSIEADDQIPM